MATLKDIARKLDLSITQVSRALNDHSDVNEETRLRVKEAARAMNYHPNVSARKLVSGRSGMVFADAEHGVTVAVDAATDSGFVVTISNRPAG